MKFISNQKWKLTFKVIPLVVLVVILKFISHYFGIEFLSLSPLFTAIISANIFLIGFLVTGVLSDYKESEKLPLELTTSLETIVDECEIIYKNKKASAAKECSIYIENLTSSLLSWFQKKTRTTEIIDLIVGLNNYYLSFEPLTQANFISRMKQEQNNIRKMVLRIDAIRDTSFNAAGYAIAEAITAILVIGMIFVKIDPYYESIFFVSFVSFILVYMVALIRDLDNPFGYYQEEALAEEVSIKSILDLKERLITRNKELK